MDRRLIDHFVNANLLSRQEMQRAILRASKDKTGVVTQLLDAGLIEDELLAEQIADFYQQELVLGHDINVDPGALGLLTEGIALKAGALPYAYEPGTNRLMVATFDPERAKDVLDMLSSATGQQPLVRVAPRSWLLEQIPLLYQQPRAGQELRGSRTNFGPGARGQSNAFSERPASGVHRVRRGRDAGSRMSTRQLNSSPDINGALDDFDDFLKDEEPVLSPRSSFAGRPNTFPGMESQQPLTQQPARTKRARRAQRAPDDSFANLSGGPAFWENEVSTAQNQSRWGWDEPSQAAPAPVATARPGSQPKPKGNFSLFDQPAESSAKDLTLQEIVEQHHQKIKGLKEEAQRQREVIQALADMLIEARVISRRELKRRLQTARKDDDR